LLGKHHRRILDENWHAAGIRLWKDDPETLEVGLLGVGAQDKSPASA
jgi:hypothetical protein